MRAQMKTRNAWKCWALSKVAATFLVLVAVGLAERSAFAQYAYPTLDFTTINGGQLCSDGILVTTQYFPEVIFPAKGPATMATPPDSGVAPYPGDRCVLAGPNFGLEFHPGDFTMQFPEGASLVQLYAGSDCDNVVATLTAYNCQGTTCNVVAPPVTHPLDNGIVDVAFMVGTNTPEINQVVLTTSGYCNNAIDNLTVTGNPPPSTLPPYPTLQATLNGGPDYTAGGITVEGFYSGTNLNEIAITLTSQQTQSGQPSVQTTTIPLSGADATNAPLLSVIALPGTVPLGSYEVVVTITDNFNQSTHSVIDFDNFGFGVGLTDPTAGNFLFGVNDVNCRYGFYQNGAIAQISATGATFFVPELIAQKWLAVQSTFPALLWPNLTLGCPLAAALTVDGNYVDNFQSGTIQEFEHGRIYVPPQMPTVYTTALMRSVLHDIVPTEIINNVQRNMGVASEVKQVGWPTADPAYDLDVDNPTWLFQRFSREANADPVTGPATWNTIEIRGGGPNSTPPGITLFVERIGGDLTELGAAQTDPIAGTVPNPTPTFDSTTPTVWQEFPCAMGTTDKWPTSCDLSSLLPLEGPPPSSYRPISGYCSPDKSSHEQNQQTVCDREQDETSCDNDNCNTWDFQPPAGVDLVVDNIKAWSTIVPYADSPSSPVTDMNVFHGIVADSDFSSEDNPFDHTYCVYPSDDSLTGLWEDVVDAATCLTDTGGTTLACVDSQYAPGAPYCRADWDTHSRPLPTANDWSFLGYSNVYVNVDSNKSPIPRLEVEFEKAFATDYFVNFQPWPGDLVTIHGRQIIDCGHCPYHSEIHPPDFFAASRSAIYFHPYANTTDPNVRTTEAYLWANAFLQNPGGTITSPTITINPPPRTSATAKLYVYKQEQGYYQATAVVPKFKDANDGEQISFTGTNLTEIVETPAGQWIYPGSVSANSEVLPYTVLPSEDASPNPPDELTGPRYVDSWVLAWTTAELF